MATKNKTIFVKIKPQFCKKELLTVLQEVGKVIKSDTQKGIYICTYSYYFQKVKVKVVVRPEKDLSAIFIEGTTDDLIGTGAKKAIAKIEEGITGYERDYKIDYDIDDAYLRILKRSYSDFDFMIKAKDKRQNDFKVFHGLALCYLNARDNLNAEHHFEKALSLIPSEKRTEYRRKMVMDLFRLKAFKMSAKLFEPIFNTDKNNVQTVLLYLLLKLNSGDLAETIHILVSYFPSNPEFLLRLLKENSVLEDKKLLLNKNISTLIKAIRGNIKFNAQPESLKYLVSVNRTQEALQYQKSLVSFYKKKNINYNQFINLYYDVIKAGKEVDRKGIENLLLENKNLIINYKKEINSLNAINTSAFTAQVPELEKLTLKIQQNIEKFESAREFKQFIYEIGSADKLRSAIADFLKNFKNELIRQIELRLKLKKPTEARDAILLFTDIYGSPPPNEGNYLHSITQQQKERERSLKRKRQLKFQGAGLIGVLAIIFYFTTNRSSADGQVNGKQAEKESPDIENIIVEKIPEEEITIETIPEISVNLSWYLIDQLKEKIQNELKYNQDSPDRFVLDFIEEYNKVVKTLNSELYELENYPELNSLEWSNQKEWFNLQELLDQKGLGTGSAEGNLYLIPKTGFIRSAFSGINDPVTQKFIDLYCIEIEDKCCEDAGIMISETELVKRIYNWGELASEAEYSAYEELAQKEFNFYLWAAYKGMDNTPSFDYSSGKFNENVFIAMTDLVNTYPNSRASEAFRPFLALLQQEDFEETNTVSNYVSNFSPY